MKPGTARSVPVSAPKVDLVFDVECPNVDGARWVIRQALVAAGFQPVWREWTRDSADTPPALRGLASPTIFIDGNDVSVDARSTTGQERWNSCRIYDHGDALSGAPPLEVVSAALTEAHSRMR